jgi:hypothetical protein
VRCGTIRDAFSSSQRHGEELRKSLDDWIVAAQVVAALDHPRNGTRPKCLDADDALGLWPLDP